MLGLDPRAKPARLEGKQRRSRLVRDSKLQSGLNRDLPRRLHTIILEQASSLPSRRELQSPAQLQSALTPHVGSSSGRRPLVLPAQVECQSQVFAVSLRTRVRHKDPGKPIRADDYRAYLDKYPDGVYAPLAKRRIAQLNAHLSEQAPASEAETKKALATTQQSSKPQGSAPVTMTECEGANNCATWTFLGTQGNGQWPSGETANLSVERVDAASVLIRRADSTGPSAGLTAVYKGTRNGDRIDGEYTSSWPGHWETNPEIGMRRLGRLRKALPP